MPLLDEGVPRSRCRMGDSVAAALGQCFLPPWITETLVGTSAGGGGAPPQVKETAVVLNLASLRHFWDIRLHCRIVSS